MTALPADPGRTPASSTSSPASPRRRLNLNRDWRFRREDVAGAEAVRLDDATWEPIGLPHTFDLPYFRTPEFYVGYGWYRRSFDADPSWTSKRLFLEFDGVFQVAEVFVNGQRAGEHRGGYTGFIVDITDFVRSGTNQLAVRVNNEWSPQLVPRAGEHIFSGGIYRDVHLLVVDPLHVAWNGTWITTPQVSRELATVNIKTELHNGGADVADCSLRSVVYDPSGNEIASVETTHSVETGDAVVDQEIDQIVSPLLWHPDTPNLYVLQTIVMSGGKVVDETETPFGFRWFEWTADRGFFLNGEHCYLRGANVHQDHAGWGIGATQAASYRDVKLMKEAGFNFVRGAHYPHHTAFARACDEIGLIFWSENCFWGKGGFGPEGYWNASAFPVNPEDFEPFAEHCRQTLREMIRINRNHPSIVVWSMTNEAFFTYHVERAKELVADLCKLSRELDPTRPAAVGGCQRGDFDKLGDVAGYNGDGARLFIDPGVPNMVSEYGAISKPHDAYDPFFGDLQAEQYPWRAGQAIWCGIDYGTIAGRQGLKGIVDHYRLPKRSWHWYRNEYLKIEPPAWPEAGVAARLGLSADKTTIRGTDATDDCQVVVTVLDDRGRLIGNTPPVTLTIESGPGEFPTGRSITFDPVTDIKITSGQAAIAMRSYHAGESVIRATSPGLTGATITITTEGSPAFIAGRTPLANRPYMPPPLSAASVRAAANVVNVARDRPSRASSESSDHPARAANDGHADTTWEGVSSQGPTWWQVDLEGFYQISGSRITFAADGNYRFLVELSENGSTWILAVNRSGSVNTSAVRNDIYPPGAIARFVRVTFVHVPPGNPPGLRDVEVYGVLSVH